MYSKVHDSARKLDDWAQSKLIVAKKAKKEYTLKSDVQKKI